MQQLIAQLKNPGLGSNNKLVCLRAAAALEHLTQLADAERAQRLRIQESHGWGEVKEPTDWLGILYEDYLRNDTSLSD